MASSTSRLRPSLFCAAVGEMGNRFRTLVCAKAGKRTCEACRAAPMPGLETNTREARASRHRRARARDYVAASEAHGSRVCLWSADRVAHGLTLQKKRTRRREAGGSVGLASDSAAASRDRASRIRSNQSSQASAVGAPGLSFGEPSMIGRRNALVCSLPVPTSIGVVRFAPVPPTGSPLRFSATNRLSC